MTTNGRNEDALADIGQALGILFAGVPETAYIGVSAFSKTEPADNASFMMNQNMMLPAEWLYDRCYVDKRDAYFRLSYMAEKPAIGRGKAVDTAGCLWAWADADTYKSDKTNEEADTCAESGELAPPPTLNIDTGYGRQLLWRLKQHQIDIDALQGCNRWIQEQLKEYGADGVSDPARVFRVPGTINYKRGQERPVTIVSYHPERQYDLSDFGYIAPSAKKPNNKRKERKGNTQEEGYQTSGIDRTKEIAWLHEYVGNHAPPINKKTGKVNNSDHFHRLIGAVLRRFQSEEIVYDVAETISEITGCKYSSRLEEEVRRSLDKYEQQRWKDGEIKSMGEGLSPITLDFLQVCYEANQYGDSLLFAQQYSGIVCYDTGEKQWYIFADHYWQTDHGKVRALLAQGCVKAYKWLVEDLKAKLSVAQSKGKPTADDKKVISALQKLIEGVKKRIQNLQSLRYADSVLAYATGNEKIDMPLLDIGEVPSLQVDSLWWEQTDPWLTGTLDGVVDAKLGRGDGALRAGRPEDRLRHIAPTHWTGLDTPDPTFKRCLYDMFSDREPAVQEEMVAFMELLLGYGLYGAVAHHIFVVLHGEDGRNGKSLLFQILSSVLGQHYAGIVDKAVVLKRKAAQAGAASPHIADLKHKRFALILEPKEGEQFDDGELKMHTGGDRPIGRNLFQNNDTFPPTHLLILACNHRPHISADANAVWSRAIPIELNVRFLSEGETAKRPFDRVADTRLSEKLQAEASGILASMVRGLLDWQRADCKLEYPQDVIDAKRAYQKSEDTLGQFRYEMLNDEEADAGETTDNKVLYRVYTRWCNAGNLLPMTSIAFGRKMAKLYENYPSNGLTIYKKIRYRTDPKEGNLYVVTKTGKKRSA